MRSHDTGRMPSLGGGPAKFRPSTAVRLQKNVIFDYSPTQFRDTGSWLSPALCPFSPGSTRVSAPAKLDAATDGICQHGTYSLGDFPASITAAEQ